MPHSRIIKENQYSAWDDDDLTPENSVATSASASLEASSAHAASDAAIELIVEAGASGERLDKWLAKRLPEHSRARLQKWIEAGHVRVNGEAGAVRRALWGGDVVRVNPQRAAEDSAFAAEAVALDIVFEDETLLVIDKRAGLVVHPATGNWSGTVLNGLLHHAPQLAALPRAGIVHRLDKDTSGLMVVARTDVAQTDLVRQLQARTVGRIYVAVVHGTPPASGRIDAPIGRHPRERTRMTAFKPQRGTTDVLSASAKPAATAFTTLRVIDGDKTHGPLAVVLCELETGRTHQIRVHMQAIGHPLVGDPVYGKPGDALGFARQALHAWRLGMIHPVTRAACQWTAPLPADMLALLDGLDVDGSALLAERRL